MPLNPYGGNPGLGPSPNMSMGSRLGRRMGGNSMMPPPPQMNMQPFTGGPDQGRPAPPGFQMGGNPQAGTSWARRDIPGGGFGGGINPPGRRMGQQPGFGMGTGSKSRTSNDWKQRNPNDMGPIGPSKFPHMDPNIMNNLRQQLQPQPGRVTDMGGGSYGSLANARRMNPQYGNPMQGGGMSGRMY